MIAISHSLFGQKEGVLWSPTKTLIIPPGTDSLQIDTLPVVLSSLKLLDSNGDSSATQYSITGSTVSYIKFEHKTTDTLNLLYTAIPLDLNSSYKNKDTSLILPKITSLNPKKYDVGTPQAFQPFDGLNSKGSISRAISVGNNQDAVLNSSLDLQLSGQLGKGTEIRASITDNNIPVQPDGYTQQLREFDRVYIELENEDFGLLRAGDYNINARNNYFLSFDKRISGAGVFSKIPLSGGALPFGIQGGIARGKFSRNRFSGQEGNQGPYKLVGTNGERFVIIISGSERVYIDGILMKRGQQFDYTIDYNAGEITFTSLQPITREKRIVVEFQYTEQNYLRSIAFGNAGFQNDRFKTNIQFYSEQDSKSQSLVQDLSDFEKSSLSTVGDKLDDALISTIAAADFNPALIQYNLVDTLGFSSVLVYSTDSTQQKYNASFTFLGTGRGDYVLAQSNANGRVFKWVAPDNGVSQGDYAPVKQLIAPNQLQVLTFETEAEISDHQKLRVDFALSKNDINLFSDIDKGNDIGAATRINYDLNGKLGKWDWLSSFRFEMNQENFRTVERIRRVEFARDWNLPLNYNGATQISGLRLGVRKDKNSLIYSLDLLNIDQYQGFKNELNSQLNTSRQIAKVNASWLNNSDSILKGNFIREQLHYRYYLKPKIWTGIRSVGEQNERRAIATDSLVTSSYRFLEAQLFVGIGDTAKSFGEISYLQRWDDTASDNLFKNYSQVSTIGLHSNFKTNFNSRLQVFANVRNRKVFLPVELALERTVTSRLNYLQKIFKNSIISTTFYETGSGSEAKRSFSYVEVPAGTGTYTHTDYNNNGIRELDEFEIAPTPDLARFVRVFTPSDQYVRTSLNKFGQNLNINAPYAWKNLSGLKSKLAHFSVLINYQLDRKTLQTGNFNNLNPFAKIDNDTLIVALNNSFRNTLFFNRSSSIFGMEYTYLNTDNRSLLSFGVEKRSSVKNAASLRYRILKPILLKTGVESLQKSNTSQNFSSRNFNISELNNTYSIAFQPNDKFVIGTSYKWGQQGATSENEADLFQQDLGFNLNYNLAENFNSLVEFNYIINRFEGQANSPAGFEMLQGLKPGKNATWNVSIQKTIRKNILLSLNYNGRISEGGIPINTGNLQIKAFF